MQKFTWLQFSRKTPWLISKTKEYIYNTWEFYMDIERNALSEYKMYQVTKTLKSLSHKETTNNAHKVLNAQITFKQVGACKNFQILMKRDCIHLKTQA